MGYPPSAPPPTLPAGCVAVVGQQYCAPYPVDLTVRKKALSLSEGDIVVTDVNGALVLKLLKTQLEVFLASNTSENVCDFKVKGSFFERSCTICVGESNTIIAQMKRKYTVTNVLMGRDTFGVTVYPNNDYAFVVALVMIMDEINRDMMGDDDI
ncbi:Protein LURP-one-related 15 [Acorus calamus]|uniref:Protein LURP-one-related 15 n=1 Tax=Acorus calamus TaxID=4465 RepID=A0AAV9C656_ACOCL|nr:Protein LURP-one-related 15 [Acorus calamus]